VEQTERLPCPVVDGHRRHYARGRKLRDVDSQGVLEAAGMEPAQPGEPVWFVGHAESYNG
jgi:hypothetical protein